MQIDIRLILQAQALADHGSISRAPAALDIAQPTLSRSIKDLEERIGLPLFTRHQHGVRPTDFGRVFLQQAARVSAQVADLEREIDLEKGLQTGEVALGAGPYAAEALVPAALRRFAAAHPSMRLRIQVAEPALLVRALRERHLDLVVAESSVIEADDDVEILERMAPITGHLFGRAGHPLAGRASVSLASVLGYPYVQISRLPPRLMKPMLDLRAIRKAGAPPLPPFPAIECPTVPLGVSAIIDSNAIMLASLGMMRAEMERGRVVPILHLPWMASNWSVACLKTRSLGPGATALSAELGAAHQEALREDELLRDAWLR